MKALILCTLFSSAQVAPESVVRATVPASGAAADGLLAAVPAESVFALSVADIGALRERGAQSAWYRLFSDPRVWGVVEELIGDELDELFAVDPAQPIDPWKLADSVRGGVALFVVPGLDGESGVGGILVEPGEQRAEFEEAFDALLAHMDDETPAEALDYGGAQLTLWEAPASADQAFPFGSEGVVLAALETEGFAGFVMGVPRELVVDVCHGAIDRYQGTDPSEGLAGSTDLAEARQAVGRAAGPEFIAAIGPILRLAMADADPKVVSIIERIGLFDLKWIYGSAGIGEGEALELHVGAHLPEGSWIAELAGFAGPISPDVFRMMPEDALSVFASHYDFAGAVRLVLELVAEIDEKAHAGVQQGLAGIAEISGVDPLAELIEQLTGHYAGFTVRAETEASEGSITLPTRDAWIVGLRDVETVSLAVETLLESPILGGLASQIEAEQFQGHEVLTVPSPFGLQFSWSFLSNALVLSEGVEPVRSVLRAAGKEDAPSALTNPKFGPVIRAAGAVVQLSVTDTPAIMKEMLGFAVGLDAFPGELFAELEPALIDEYFRGVMVQTVRRGPRSLSLHVTTH